MEIGQDRGGQWGVVGSYAGYFELKKGDLEWGFRAPEMETEKGDSWEGEGETPENPERHEALCMQEAHGAPAQALHTPIVVTEAHELKAPPPAGEEGGCWSCYLLSFPPLPPTLRGPFCTWRTLFCRLRPLSGQGKAPGRVEFL